MGLRTAARSSNLPGVILADLPPKSIRQFLPHAPSPITLAPGCAWAKPADYYRRAHMGTASAVAFNFESKEESDIPVAQAAEACREGRFCWVDVDVAADRAVAEAALRDL